MKERDKINLTREEHKDLCLEEYFSIDGKCEPIIIWERTNDGSGRHTEYHSLVFQVISTDKYYRVNYEDSVKDEMGWDECNEGDTYATEVFPKETKTIIYE